MLKKNTHGMYNCYHAGCRCSLCMDAFRAFCIKHREARNAAQRRNYQKHKSRRLEQAKQHREKLGKAEIRNRNLKYKFNISSYEYSKILENQKNACVICKRFPPGRPLDVDHSHKTNKVRGLLCRKCNGTLGWFEKYSSEILLYLMLDNPALVVIESEGHQK